MDESSFGTAGIFAGGTSGIGAATSKEFVRHASQPTVYIIGQNSKRGSAVVEELKKINRKAKITFIQSDLTLLRNVDEVCRQIQERESKVNVLFLTTGFLSLNGRDETSEGLDKMLSLQYYSRMRFIVNLLPLLKQASHEDELARVVSVLGGGREGRLFQNDLALEKSYNLKARAGHAICMTSLALEELAIANPTVKFIHSDPGAVRGTNILNGMGTTISVVGRILMSLASPFTSSLEDCATLHLGYITKNEYFPKDEGHKTRSGTKTTVPFVRISANGKPSSQNQV